MLGTAAPVTTGTASPRGIARGITARSASGAPWGDDVQGALAEETGVVTENPYDDPKMWGALNHVAENGEIGTGLAIGDYDGDGRPDIFVVSKTRSCRLFRNLGNWKFEDVTEKAGVGDSGEAAGIWKQGATFADVDNNGLLDLYVCRYGAPNLLYINQGDGTFREEAAATGWVNDACVMAAFCDYDRDGHLDVFIQTNLLEAPPSDRPARLPLPQQRRRHVHGRHRARGDHRGGAGAFGRVVGLRRGRLAGPLRGKRLRGAGQALPEQPRRHVHGCDRPGGAHMPYSSMGSDLGDVDNDGRIDLLVAEMAPTTHQKDQRTRRPRGASSRTPRTAPAAAPQVMRNALYLNTGTGRCLEAACLAGLAATDWTWSVRLRGPGQ